MSLLDAAIITVIIIIIIAIITIFFVFISRRPLVVPLLAIHGHLHSRKAAQAVGECRENAAMFPFKSSFKTMNNYSL